MPNENEPNPVSDVLESGSFASLAQVLRERVGVILEKWGALVREVLPRADAMTLAQVRDQIPQTLAMLADALESTRPDEMRDLTGTSGAHGTERFSQGYNIEELLVEYRLLRRVVIDEVESHLGRRTTKAEDLALSMGIDTVLAQGVVAFFRHLEAELRAAADAETKFLAYLSHDLRNQLNHILLILELITMKLRNKPDVAENLHEIENAREAVYETVDGMERLLKTARLKSGHAQVKLGAVDLEELVQGLSLPFVREGGLKGINLVTRVPPGATCISDRRLLMVIVHNLLSNAVKYSEKGTVSIAVEMLERGGWRITIADEGAGMSEEFTQQMFGEFVRGETHGKPGTGLGLAIVARAAKLIGADLAVESKPGDGTTFRITCLTPPTAAPPTAQTP